MCEQLMSGATLRSQFGLTAPVVSADLNDMEHTNENQSYVSAVVMPSPLSYGHAKPSHSLATPKGTTKPRFTAAELRHSLLSPATPMQHRASIRSAAHTPAHASTQPSLLDTPTADGAAAAATRRSILTPLQSDSNPHNAAALLSPLESGDGGWAGTVSMKPVIASAIVTPAKNAKNAPPAILRTSDESPLIDWKPKRRASRPSLLDSPSSDVDLSAADVDPTSLITPVKPTPQRTGLIGSAVPSAGAAAEPKSGGVLRAKGVGAGTKSGTFARHRLSTSPLVQAPAWSPSSAAVSRNVTPAATKSGAAAANVAAGSVGLVSAAAAAAMAQLSATLATAPKPTPNKMRQSRASTASIVKPTPTKSAVGVTSAFASPFAVPAPKPFNPPATPASATAAALLVGNGAVGTAAAAALAGGASSMPSSMSLSLMSPLNSYGSGSSALAGAVTTPADHLRSGVALGFMSPDEDDNQPIVVRQSVFVAPTAVATEAVPVQSSAQPEPVSVASSGAVTMSVSTESTTTDAVAAGESSAPATSEFVSSAPAPTLFSVVASAADVQAPTALPSVTPSPVRKSRSRLPASAKASPNKRASGIASSGIKPSPVRSAVKPSPVRSGVKPSPVRTTKASPAPIAIKTSNAAPKASPASASAKKAQQAGIVRRSSVGSAADSTAPQAVAAAAAQILSPSKLTPKKAAVSHKSDYSTPDKTTQSAFVASGMHFADVQSVLATKDSVWTDRVLAFQRIKKWCETPNLVLESASPAIASLFDEKQPKPAAAMEQLSVVVAALTPGFVVQLSELRSQIIKEACECLSAVAVATGAAFPLSFVNSLFPLLLALTRNTKKAMSEPAHEAMKQIVRSAVGCAPAITILAETATTHKADVIRQRSIEYLALAMASAPTQQIGWPAEAQTPFRSVLESKIPVLLEDSFRAARAAAITLYVSLWRRDKSRFQSVFQSLPARVQKSVLATAITATSGVEKAAAAAVIELKGDSFFATFKVKKSTSLEFGADTIAAINGADAPESGAGAAKVSLAAMKKHARSKSAVLMAGAGADPEIVLFVSEKKSAAKSALAPVAASPVAAAAVVEATPESKARLENLLRWKLEKEAKQKVQSESAQSAAALLSLSFSSTASAAGLIAQRASADSVPGETPKGERIANKRREQRANVLSPTMKEMLPEMRKALSAASSAATTPAQSEPNSTNVSPATSTRLSTESIQSITSWAHDTRSAPVQASESGVVAAANDLSSVSRPSDAGASATEPRVSLPASLLEPLPPHLQWAEATDANTGGKGVATTDVAGTAVELEFGRISSISNASVESAPAVAAPEAMPESVPEAIAEPVAAPVTAPVETAVAPVEAPNVVETAAPVSPSPSQPVRSVKRNLLADVNSAASSDVAAPADTFVFVPSPPKQKAEAEVESVLAAAMDVPIAPASPVAFVPSSLAAAVEPGMPAAVSPTVNAAQSTEQHTGVINATGLAQPSAAAFAAPAAEAVAVAAAPFSSVASSGSSNAAAAMDGSAANITISPISFSNDSQSPIAQNSPNTLSLSSSLNISNKRESLTANIVPPALMAVPESVALAIAPVSSAAEVVVASVVSPPKPLAALTIHAADAPIVDDEKEVSDVLRDILNDSNDASKPPVTVARAAMAVAAAAAAAAAVAPASDVTADMTAPLAPVSAQAFTTPNPAAAEQQQNDEIDSVLKDLLIDAQSPKAVEAVVVPPAAEAAVQPAAEVVESAPLPIAVAATTEAAAVVEPEIVPVVVAAPQARFHPTSPAMGVSTLESSPACVRTVHSDEPVAAATSLHVAEPTEAAIKIASPIKEVEISTILPAAPAAVSSGVASPVAIKPDESAFAAAQPVVVSPTLMVSPLAASTVVAEPIQFQPAVADVVAVAATAESDDVLRPLSVSAAPILASAKKSAAKAAIKSSTPIASAVAPAPTASTESTSFASRFSPVRVLEFFSPAAARLLSRRGLSAKKPAAAVRRLQTVVIGKKYKTMPPVILGIILLFALIFVKDFAAVCWVMLSTFGASVWSALTAPAPASTPVDSAVAFAPAAVPLAEVMPLSFDSQFVCSANDAAVDRNQSFGVSPVATVSPVVLEALPAAVSEMDLTGVVFEELVAVSPTVEADVSAAVAEVAVVEPAPAPADQIVWTDLVASPLATEPETISTPEPAVAPVAAPAIAVAVASWSDSQCASNSSFEVMLPAFADAVCEPAAEVVETVVALAPIVEAVAVETIAPAPVVEAVEVVTPATAPHAAVAVAVDAECPLSNDVVAVDHTPYLQFPNTTDMDAIRAYAPEDAAFVLAVIDQLNARARQHVSWLIDNVPPTADAYLTEASIEAAAAVDPEVVAANAALDAALTTRPTVFVFEFGSGAWVESPATSDIVLEMDIDTFLYASFLAAVAVVTIAVQTLSAITTLIQAAIEQTTADIAQLRALSAAADATSPTAAAAAAVVGPSSSTVAASTNPLPLPLPVKRMPTTDAFSFAAAAASGANAFPESSPLPALTSLPVVGPVTAAAQAVLLQSPRRIVRARLFS